jgi:Arc/MetJ-type ribon-helix-helix transcriptional regulator
MREEKIIPVRLPGKLVEEVDKLVEEGLFLSRSEALRYGARILVLLSMRPLTLHQLAEEISYLEARKRLRRRE